jgi:hypothetical protein
MIKYIVIRTDGRTEFDTLEKATEYFNQIDNAVEVRVVNEPDVETYAEKEVACWRMRAVMELAGLKGQIDALIEALPQPDKTIALAAWEYGNTVSSISPFVKGIQSALSLTDKQVFDFFVQAENLVA